MIDFSKIKEIIIKNFKGGKGETTALIYDNGSIRIMKATLKEGCSIGKHTHETNSEVAYVISGTATYNIEGKEELVHTNECHYCPKGGTHSVINNYSNDLILLCIIAEQ